MSDIEPINWEDELLLSKQKEPDTGWTKVVHHSTRKKQLKAEKHKEEQKRDQERKKRRQELLEIEKKYGVCNKCNTAIDGMYANYVVCQQGYSVNPHIYAHKDCLSEEERWGRCDTCHEVKEHELAIYGVSKSHHDNCLNEETRYGICYYCREVGDYYAPAIYGWYNDAHYDCICCCGGKAGHGIGGEYSCGSGWCIYLEQTADDNIVNGRSRKYYGTPRTLQEKCMQKVARK
jgi:hypothetical protein